MSLFFNCVRWHPRAFLSFLVPSPHFWLVHLAVITSIVTKHTRLLHAHQNRWCWYVCLMMIITFFPPFSPIVPGNKVTQNHMLACQALITDRRWSALFWGLSFSIQISMFFFSLLSLLSVFCSTEGFSFSFILALAAVHNLLTKTDCHGAGYPSRLSIRAMHFFFSFWRLAILGNMKESYRGIRRIALWFGLAFHLSWIVPLNFLKEEYCFGMQKVQVLGFTWCEGSQA